jgi:hypothetical protein
MMAGARFARLYRVDGLGLVGVLLHAAGSAFSLHSTAPDPHVSQ